MHRRLASALSIAALLAATLATTHASAAQPKDTDELLTTPGTPDIVAKGMEADGYSLAISAYSWGYPLVRMERMMREYTDVPSPRPATSYRAPLNQMGWATALATPDAKDLPTPDIDAYATSTVLELTEPYVLTVPATHGRYYVIDVFNMWHEIEHYVGRRVTGTQAGHYLIAPPGWKGKVPAGMKRLDVSTNRVWLWGRLQARQGEDAAPVLALQKQFSLRPLSGKAAAAASLPPLPDTADDPFGFFRQLGFVLQTTPVKQEDRALVARFKRIGLTPQGFDPGGLSEATRQGMVRGLRDGPLMVIASLAGTARLHDGWNWVNGLDSARYDYPLRALVASRFLGAQGEQEAMYPQRFTDSEGRALSGDNRYLIKLPSAPPVDAFWSLTLYDAGDRMLVPNALNRYKIGSDTPGLKVAADGSITIPVQAARPEGDYAANWLPAPPGGFFVILRMYQPRPQVLENSWALPQVSRLP